MLSGCSTEPTALLPGPAFADETYTFLLTVVCDGRTVLEGESTVSLKDSDAAVEPIVLQNSATAKETDFEDDSWRERARGRLVVLRHSDQAMALVWSDRPPHCSEWSEYLIFGDVDWEGNCCEDVGHSAIERRIPILERHVSGCGYDREDRYLLFIADISSDCRTAEIDIQILIDEMHDVDRVDVLDTHDWISSLAVCALRWIRQATA